MRSLDRSLRSVEIRCRLIALSEGGGTTVSARSVEGENTPVGEGEAPQRWSVDLELGRAIERRTDDGPLDVSTIPAFLR
jgi:hypothetical protein